MTNNADPDQLASSGYIRVCIGKVYPGSAGQGLKKQQKKKQQKTAPTYRCKRVIFTMMSITFHCFI